MSGDPPSEWSGSIPGRSLKCFTWHRHVVSRTSWTYRGGSVREPGAVGLCWSLRSRFQVVVQIESGFLSWALIYFLWDFISVLIRKGNQTLYYQLCFVLLPVWLISPVSKLVPKGNEVYMIALSSCCSVWGPLAHFHQICQGNECFMQKCCLCTSLWRLGMGLRNSAWDEARAWAPMLAQELASMCALQIWWVTNHLERALRWPVVSLSGNWGSRWELRTVRGETGDGEMNTKNRD